jgi:predicted TPR repeat methyltransferase
MIKNPIFGFLKRFGPRGIKRAIWNKELASAKDPENTDPITPLIEKFAGGGAILDLGCGIGYLGEYIDTSRYSTYLGVDISDSAVEDAKRRRKSLKLHFVASDIELYVPEGKFNVIAFKDSIYYIPFSKLETLLTRYKTYLLKEGVFIVRIADGKRYPNIFRLIESNFNLVERYNPHDTDVVVLVFN